MKRPGPTSPRLRRLAGGAAGMTVVRFASLGLGLVISALLARVLGPTEFGVFSFAISLATLLSLPLTGGLPTLMMREIAAGGARGEPGLQIGVLRWGYRLLAIVVGALILASLAVWGIGRAAGLWPWDGRATLVGATVVVLIPLLSLQQIQRSVLSGHHKVVLGLLGEQLFRPLAMLALIGLAWPLLARGSTAALGLQIAALVLAVLVSFAVMARVLPAAAGVPPQVRSRDWLWALLPLTALTTTTIVKNNTDILMLGVLETPESVGLYRIAAQVAIMATVVMQILRSLSAPAISAAFARGDTAALRRHFVRSSRIMFAAALVFVVLFAAFGRPALVLVFGPEYAGSWGPCLALALGSLFSSSCGLVGVALQMTRHAGAAARSAVISAVVNVVLNLILIPPYGTLGAAIATSIALVAMQAQQWLIARRVLGLRTDAFQRSRP